MADMVTKQELEAAKIDVKHAGEAVNEEKVVKTRLGRSFKSIPLIVKEGEAKITQAAQTITSATASIVAQKNQASATISEAESDVSTAAASVHQRGNQEITNLQNAINIAAAAGAGAAGWTASLVVDGDKNQHQINDITTQNIPSISSLRLFKPRKDGQVVNVLSHRAGFNLGGGFFKWDASSTLADNSFNVIKVTAIATGRFIRVLNSSIASIEDAGGVSGEDVSNSVNTLLSANIKIITGQTGATYTVNAVTLNKGVRFLGDFTITKPNKDDRIFNLHTGKYTIEWDGVTFDGKYAGDGVEGAEDIVVTEATSDGLVINFKNCKNHNISKKLLRVGYPSFNRIREVNSIDCSGNGNHMYRGDSEERWIYETNNVTYTNIENYSETGDGEFSESAGVVARMPMPVLYATNSRVTLRKPMLRKAGGFILYKACDNALMSEPDIDETMYPFRVQQAKNTRLVGGSITRCPFSSGAVRWQPYARIATALRRVEEGLSGLTIDGTSFDGNNVDVSITGDHLYSGLHGVTDCRARGVKINAIFNGTKTAFCTLQDAEADLRGSIFKVSAIQQVGFRHAQTAQNGALKLNLNNTKWDGSLRLAADADFQIVLNADVTSVQQETAITLEDSELHNIRAQLQYLIYWRGAKKVSIRDTTWTGTKPKRLLQVRDNDIVIVKDNVGFTYPMNDTNGGNVNFFDAATLRYIDTDITRQSEHKPSIFYVGNGSTPTYSALALGSIAKIYNPVAGGSADYVYTNNGWRASSAITA